jgi:hypothetical protein
VDGSSVRLALAVLATRSIEVIDGRVVLALALLSGLLEVKEVVRSDTKDLVRAGDRLVLQDDGGDVDRVRVELGRGGDGVEPGLKTGESADDTVERNGPDGVTGGRSVGSGEDEDLGETKALGSDLLVVVRLVRAELLEGRASLLVRGELGESTDSLTGGVGGDVEVVTEDGAVGSGNGEGDLGESGIEGLDVDGRVALVGETENGKKTLDFRVGVERPNRDMVASLVADAGIGDVELGENAVALAVLEELLCLDEGSGVGVLGVENTAGTVEGTSRELAEVNFGLIDLGKLADLEVRNIAAGSFLPSELRVNRIEQTVLPLEVVFLHVLVVISLTALANALRSEIGETLVEDAADGVEVLVGRVADYKKEEMRCRERIGKEKKKTHERKRRSSGSQVHRRSRTAAPP